MNKGRKGYVSYPTNTVWPSLQRAPSTIFERAEEDVLLWLVFKPHSVNVLLLTCCVVRVIDVEYTLLQVRQFDLPISIYKVCMFVCVCLLARLQRVQNNAARLVLKRRRGHVTPLLKELHWLPVKFRCQYKIATLAYRHFEGSLPHYLSSSLCTYELSRSLRSSKEKAKNSKAKIKSFGQGSFSFMAPSLWNSLPATLRNVPTLSQFKVQLKNLVCPGLPVESKKCVASERRCIGRGGRKGGGRKHERSRQEKEARVGWVKRQIQIGVVWDH